LKPIKQLIAGGLLVLLTLPGAAQPLAKLRVMVTRGPISPVERRGVENTAPVSGATVQAQHGRTILGVQTNRQGTAVFALAAGRYEVQVTDCPGAMRLPETQVVTLSNNHTTELRFLCDTGMR
jgi:hypothetical protein